jgi:hypothetical protein
MESTELPKCRGWLRMDNVTDCQSGPGLGIRRTEADSSRWRIRYCGRDSFETRPCQLSVTPVLPTPSPTRSGRLAARRNTGTRPIRTSQGHRPLSPLPQDLRRGGGGADPLYLPTVLRTRQSAGAWPGVHPRRKLPALRRAESPRRFSKLRMVIEGYLVEGSSRFRPG